MMWALLLSLWTWFPVETPVLPMGEGDPWLYPWWYAPEDVTEQVVPLFDVPWQLWGEALPVVPQFLALSPLWVTPGALWQLRPLELPDSLPQPVTHLFSRRGTQEYTHLGGVFARPLGSWQVLLGADFREHRWLTYPLRREGYGIELQSSGWHLWYRKFASRGLSTLWSLDVKRAEFRHPVGRLTLVGMRLPYRVNFYRVRVTTRTWQLEAEGCRGHGLGRLVYRIPPPMGFLHLTAGVSGTGHQWFPDLQVTVEGPRYHWTAGYRVWSRVDSLRQHRVWPRAYLQMWGQTGPWEAWSEIAYSRDLEVEQDQALHRLDRAITGAAAVRVQGHWKGLELSGFAAAAAYAAEQDTVGQWTLRPEVGFPLRVYQGRVGFRPWSALVLTSRHWRWDAGVALDLFRSVQGEFRAEGLVSSGSLRRYTLLLAVVFPD